MVNRTSRTLITLALITAAAGLAFLGRRGLDWFIGVALRWESEIEWFGGWGLGMTIGLLVVIPVCRMYGVFNDGAGRPRRNDAASEPAIEAKDKTNKSQRNT